jgi:hypothetical protein
MSMQHGNFSPNLSVGMGIGLFFLSTTPFLCCVAYWIYYLKRHLYLFSTTGQKIGYGLFTCVMLAILGPSIFPLLIALVLLSIAISIALFLLSVVMTIIALFDGGGSKKRRFSLNKSFKVTVFIKVSIKVVLDTSARLETLLLNFRTLVLILQ